MKVSTKRSLNGKRQKRKKLLKIKIKCCWLQRKIGYKISNEYNSCNDAPTDTCLQTGPAVKYNELVFKTRGSQIIIILLTYINWRLNLEGASISRDNCYNLIICVLKKRTNFKLKKNTTIRAKRTIKQVIKSIACKSL